MEMLVDGGSVHVRVDGPDGAPTLVMVHGFLNSSRAFDPLVRMLVPEFRVVRADLLGHGLSGPSDRGYTPSAQAAVLDHLLQKLGVADPVIVGHSLGANVAIALLERGRSASGLV